MTVLEFIRKNSLLVLIVIVALAVGLVMMDYSGKGKLLTRDYYFKVNGTSYDLSEAENLGSNGLSYIHSFYSSAQRKLNDKFDANNNDTLEEEEQAAKAAWLEAHPAYTDFLQQINDVSNMWSGIGVSKRGEENMAINRAILHEEAGRLGIKPSKEQLDAYIRAIPVFINDDGSFDQALYQRMTGYRDGVPNSAAEQSFRSVVEDLMVWEILQSMLTSDANYYSPATDRITDMLLQKVSGRTAWLPATAISKPDAPTEEEIKAYWEAHKASYKTPERRIVTLYTLSATDSANANEVSAMANILLQDISGNNGRGMEDAIKKAAADPQNAAFTYTAETSSACTLDAPDAMLQVEVEYAEDKAPLATVAFKEVQQAPTVAEYEKAKAAGNTDQLVSLRQIPGYYQTEDGKVVFVRVEAIDVPHELTYEQAKEKATEALAAEREGNAVQIAADKLYAEMTAALAEGADAAFKKAEEAGATVEGFGPTGVGMAITESLPRGLDPIALMSTPKGKLMTLVVLEDGARVSMVERRTVENSDEQQTLKLLLGRQANNLLKHDIMADWLTTAYKRLEVIPSKHITGEN